MCSTKNTTLVEFPGQYFSFIVNDYFCYCSSKTGENLNIDLHLLPELILDRLIPFDMKQSKNTIENYLHVTHKSSNKCSN